MTGSTITFEKMIQAARKIVFLTGAGVSVPSGIPDYRSKGGLYSGVRQPEYLLSEQCLKREPDVFYEFVKNNLYYPDAKPNVIHQKMAEIERLPDKTVTIITQNIDGLHEKAGSKQVVNFHGSLYDCYCQKCGQTVPSDVYLHSDQHENCGGIIRPAVVLYGEAIDQRVIEASLAAVRAADLLVIVGTSFQVSPFCNLIDYRQPNAQIVAINRELLTLQAPFTMMTADAATVFAKL
ncbi:NAD-dependent protein deacylase [Listeria costaricensis]|uniref:NAD-dependent protein deacylase n=1 Tax=Listeria costaricensis TaxID=2026604 RepID=UPI000C0870F6|nr:NAD-dependent protein deacylase [Listeria costaricensis]